MKFIKVVFVLFLIGIFSSCVADRSGCGMAKGFVGYGDGHAPGMKH